jgi:maltokinase
MDDTANTENSENADLVAYVGRQRWFAGKGREWTLSGRQTVGWLRAELPAVRIELVTVDYADGDVETYQLPLVHYGEPAEHLAHALVAESVDAAGQPVWIYDALHDKEVTGLWTAGIDREDSRDGVQFHRTPGTPGVPVGEHSIVIGAEQSNTSLVFGDAAILKVFRKVSSGLNPDIEVHEALHAAASTHIAEPLGWVEGQWVDPGTGEKAGASLAMLQVFLPNATEGWEMAKTSVRDLYAEGDLHADEVGGDFAGEAHRLGEAVAEVHAAMARTLPTGTLGPAAIAERVAGMRERLDRAAAEVRELAPYTGALGSAYDELLTLTDHVPVQRIHGDLHLGQVMRTLGGWRLLDFEGEPAKPLAERRALDSPLRDVAGMLRSFDYAARHLLADHPHDPQREYRAVEWAARNRAAFCAGYASAAGSDPQGWDPLLRAFETDKAVYEVVYEARNRPTWLRIPLTAIERLAAAG